MIQLTFILLMFLIVFAIFDIWTRKIPSILLTGVLVLLVAVNMSNIGFGILAFLFALLLYEGDFYGGMADVKIISMIGMVIPNIKFFIIFAITLMVLGMGFKLVFYWKNKKTDLEFPFVPVIALTYIILLVLEVIT